VACHTTSEIVYLILCTFSDTLWSCLIPGCKGYGNASNSLKTNHDNTDDCPYKIDSWKMAIAGRGQMHKRLEIHNVLTTTTLARYY